MTNVELYEALKRSLSDEAAKMIAEVVPPARDLATRSDLLEVQASVLREIGALRDVTAALSGRIESVSRLQQWMLGFFVPLWVGTFGTMVTVVLKT